MKTCFKCGEQKLLSAFYRHPAMGDGHLGKCIECTKVDVRENYAKRREQYSAYDRERTQRPERKEAQRKQLQAFRKRWPEKNRARRMVLAALRKGKLERLPCDVCSATERIEAHHGDYSKPLDVRWLCFRCHREIEHGQIVTAVA